MLAFTEEPQNAPHIFERETRFSRDGGSIITSPVQALDVVEQVDRPMLTAREIFHEAHHQAILHIGLYDEGGDFLLAKCPVSLQPALTANKVVTRSGAIVLSAADRDGLLEAKLRDIACNLLEDFPVADPWIDDRDALDGNQLDPLGYYLPLHATSLNSARAAKTKRDSRLSNL